MNNDLLEDLLNPTAETDPSLEEENIKLAPLLSEIDTIQDRGINSFVRAILFAAEAFWKAPSTNIEGFHPSDELTEGGGVKHTQRVVRIARAMCRSQERSQHDMDIIIAAALIHDVTKGLEIDGHYSFDSMHPYTVDHFVSMVIAHEDHAAEPNTTGSSVMEITTEDCANVLRLVRCHMGPWSPIPETFPVTQTEWILHFADVIATQLHVIIDGDEVNEWRWTEPKPKRRPKIPKETPFIETDADDPERINLPS